MSADEKSEKKKRAAINPNRVSKREFVLRAARRSGQSTEVTLKVYESILSELIELASEGNDIVLTGFGRFYPHRHAGHPVRRPGSDGEPGFKEPYAVLKFSATKATNDAVAGFDREKPPLELQDDDPESDEYDE